MNELDMYLTLANYVLFIGKDSGQESKESLEKLHILNKHIEKENSIIPTLPYIHSYETQENIKSILMDFLYQNKSISKIKESTKANKENKRNVRETINEILLRLDELVDSAEETISINNNIINNKENLKEYTKKLVIDDPSYEYEYLYTMEELHNKLKESNRKLNKTIQHILIHTHSIEGLLNHFKM